MIKLNEDRAPACLDLNGKDVKFVKKFPTRKIQSNENDFAVDIEFQRQCNQRDFLALPLTDNQKIIFYQLLVSPISPGKKKEKKRRSEFRIDPFSFEDISCCN